MTKLRFESKKRYQVCQISENVWKGLIQLAVCSLIAILITFGLLVNFVSVATSIKQARASSLTYTDYNPEDPSHVEAVAKFLQKSPEINDARGTTSMAPEFRTWRDYLPLQQPEDKPFFSLRMALNSDGICVALGAIAEGNHYFGPDIDATLVRAIESHQPFAGLGLAKDIFRNKSQGLIYGEPVNDTLSRSYKNSGATIEPETGVHYWNKPPSRPSRLSSPGSGPLSQEENQANEDPRVNQAGEQLSHDINTAVAGATGASPKDIACMDPINNATHFDECNRPSNK